MEQEIEDALQNIYKNLKIEVNYKDFRQYEIIVKINYQTIEYESKILYVYNANLTFDANIDRIVHIIDTEIILKFYRRSVY